jgi:hypothetical protein
MLAEEITGSQPALDESAVRYWLEQLHGDSEGFIHVCATDNWSGVACATIEEAIGYVQMMDLRRASGIYVRVTTLREKLKPGTRGKSSDAAFLPGMWADIDIAGPGHKSPHRLPETEADAREIVAKSGLPEPTLWVHSGGGMYPWWLLQQPYRTTDDDALERAASLCRMWQDLIAHSASQLGWHYGTEVKDLARVTRIVGTVNRKVSGSYQQCQLTDGGSGVLHSFDDLFHVAVEHTMRLPAPEPPRLPVLAGQPAEGLRPGDDFNNREPWDSSWLLHDWQVHHKVGSTVYWTRPDKALRDGYSATTGRDAVQDRLYVFSSSTLLPTEQPLSKFAVYALLHHGGDYAAAAGELRRQGYGDPLPARVITKNPPKPVEPIDVRVLGLDDPPPPGNGEREPLEVGNAGTVAEWYRDNLGRGKLSGVFMRSGDMVYCPRIGEQGYVPASRDADEDGPAQVRLVTPTWLAGKIQYTYECYKRRSNGDTVNATVPVHAATIAVSIPEEMPHLRVLTSVTHTPLIRPDGSIMYTPGYDEQTRTLFLPEPGLKVPPVPTNPTKQDVQNSRDAVWELVKQFPFKTDDDLANFMGMMITPLLRTIVPPPYQMFAITAPMPGTGKTLLADVCRIVHGGVFRAEMPENPAELRKQISSILDTTTGPVIHIDNVTGVLASPILAGLLTSGRWDDRRLGTPDQISVPNNRLWVVTGNNVTIGGDLPRRTLEIRMDSNEEYPWLRTDFTIKDLREVVTAMRGDLLCALLTMVRAWVVAGCPAPDKDRADSYANWHQVVRGVLAHAEVPGLFGAPGTVPESVGSDETDWSDFLEAVYRVKGTLSWTVAELLAGCGFQAGLSIDNLPGDLPDKVYKNNGRASSVARSLARWLQYRDSRWVNGLTIRKSGTDRLNKKCWQVQVQPGREQQ